jgi:predicted house-cleaning noncanonical NTP pyrophosphatase (MazG superfamily)
MVREHPRLIKLVRDDVDKYLPTGSPVRYEALTREDHVRELRAKLVEEAIEYLLSPSVGELADIVEAVRALACVDLEIHPAPQVALEVVMDEADAKRADRGGFECGIGMWTISTAPPRHEGEHTPDRAVPMEGE